MTHLKPTTNIVDWYMFTRWVLSNIDNPDITLGDIKTYLMKYEDAVRNDIVISLHFSEDDRFYLEEYGEKGLYLAKWFARQPELSGISKIHYWW